MPNRRYLEDWEKIELDDVEEAIELDFYECPPAFEAQEDVVDENDEEDVVVEEVIENDALQLFGFVVFSDVHACTPTGDEQQSTTVRLVDFVFCDAPECGGPGGWLAWWSNDPADDPLDAHNPLLPYK